MDRKKFSKEGFLGLGAIVALPSIIASCSGDNDPSENADGNGNCNVSPTETIGPFPIITPAQYVRASIIGDRSGIPLLMTLTIQDRSNGCTPLEGAYVDVWQ